MSTVSKLVGNVIDGKPKFNREVKGEKFYTIDVQFLEAKIKVLISEYLVKESYDGVIEVTGCIMSDFKKKELPQFYFYANSIQNVDLDTPLTNELNFAGEVTKVGDFTTNARCRDILPLVMSTSSPLETTSVLYLCTRDRTARMLKDKSSKYNVEGTGYLKQYRDVYEILVTRIEVVD